VIAVKWTSKANSDLVRLHDFLAPVNPRSAALAVRALAAAPARLVEHPRLGERLEEFNPREVRYEVQNSTVYVLRLWHTREHR
jgi:plasmid stabilization system protein ParE